MATFASEDRRVIVLLGEWHGTREAPELIEKLARAALQQGLTVGVLLEQPDALNASLAALPEQARPRRALCRAGAEYFRRSRDGRATVAIGELTLTLSNLAAGGVPVSVRAMDVSDSTPFEPGTSPLSWRRDHMAANIVETSRSADVTLVLVGNNHPPALRRRLEAALQGHNLVTLRQAWDAGQAWNCQLGRCAIHPAEASATGPERRDGRTRLELVDGLRRYDGFAYVGKITASPPIRETEWCS